MKLDNNAQLQFFMRTLAVNIKTESDLKIVKQIIDIERIQTFSKKMLLLQWFFFQDPKYYESDSQMYKNALDREFKDGLIQKLSIELNIGLLKDDWGKENARTEMRKLAKDGILIRKDFKNYVISQLGKECAKFIYFKILENLISIQKLWKLIKLDLTKHNLQNIDPKITIEDLENWFIIRKINDKFTFHKKFTEFIEFLKNHPELYPREFQIIKENLISWIVNSIIRELDSRNVRFTISGKNIHYFKDKLDKIDWIYKTKCHYNKRGINLLKWAKADNYRFTSYSKEENLNTFLNRFSVLIAPAGCGKTVLLNQLSLELLTTLNLEQYNVIPLYLYLKRFQVRSGKIFYGEKELIEVESLSNEQIDSYSVELFFIKIIDACLSNYKTNDFMLKLFFSNLIKHRILLILDGWDELANDLRVLLCNFLKSLIDEKFKLNLIKNVKILIASRYIETYLNSIISKDIDLAKYQKFIINVKLPKEDEIYKCLTLVSAKIFPC